MLEKFNSFVVQNNLWNENTSLLLACSGGVDSMVLLNLLTSINQPISIAHCNFRLRGSASDKDELFLSEYAKSRNIKFYSTQFETDRLAKDSKQSIQMMARQLRYEWLESIRKEDNAHLILTAHHLDDQVETILGNIINGTGIKGLHGILPKQGKIARPMLEISKKDIILYAKENQIPYREDASNTEDKYQRNFIRHHISPLLEKVNNQYKSNFSNLAKRISDYETLSKLSVDIIRNKYLINNNLYYSISINFLRKHPARSTLIYELFSSYGFSSELCRGIDEHLDEHQSGKQFASSTHRILVDRNELLIAKLAEDQLPVQYYEKIPNQIVFGGFKIQLNVAPVKKVNVKRTNQYAYFDLDKIESPISIRQWKTGDYFYPFGLSKPNSKKVGKKKISKYFKDEKLHTIQKETTPILFSGEKCVWLVGERIDDRFKVTEGTKNVLKMKITNSPF